MEKQKSILVKKEKLKQLNSRIFNSVISMTPMKSISKKGLLYEKKFERNSLKALIKRLKNPRKYHKTSFYDEWKNKNPYHSNSTLDGSDENFTDFEQIMRKHEKEKEEERNKKLANTHLKPIMNILHPRRSDEIINLYPFRYNPNYNSIYRNVPSLKFSTPSKEFLKAKIIKSQKLSGTNNLSISKNSDIDTSKENLKNISKEKNNDNSNKNSPNKKLKLTIINNLKSISNKNIKKIKKIEINHDLRDNHVMRFSKYINRKWYMNKSSEILSYLNPPKQPLPKDIKAIDFTKIKPHSNISMLNVNELKNPSICYYNPKYDFLEKKFSIYFNREQIKKKFRTKRMLEKIVSSYNVNKYYKSINNAKLN